MDKKEVTEKKVKKVSESKATVRPKTIAKKKDETKAKIAVNEKKVSEKKKLLVDKIYATGKRKTAIAKVWMVSKGSGKIKVNGKSLIDYFKRPVYRMVINQPFEIVKAEGMYDIECQF